VANRTTAYAPSPSFLPNVKSSFTFSGERFVLKPDGLSSPSEVISVRIV